MKSLRSPQTFFSSLKPLIAAAVVLLPAAQLHARTWTSSDGTKTFEGELTAYNPATGAVEVEVGGGRKMSFTEDKLSEADIAFLREQGAISAPSARPAAGSTAIMALPDELPAPDGEEADMSKPVQVYILLGQSNMLGFGKIAGGDGSLLHAVKEKKKYPYLMDDAGEWTVRKDVRNVRVMHDKGRMRVFNNEWMTITGGNIGPEIGIGHYVGHVTEAPVMILKSCIGNRSLGWDLLPPSVKAYKYDGKLQPGYGETPETAGQGPTKPAGSWYAGKQYDDDVANAKAVLDELKTYYPGANGYEVAGFFWWQGDKDMRNPAHFNNYETHLVELIKSLRKDFNAPDAKFVTASLGQTKDGDKSGHGVILDAMKSVSRSNDPELKGAVGFVYTHPLSQGGSSSGHYNGNAETYMNVGEAMGRAMVELLSGK